MESEKLKILYIASSGFSGSTVLELLLGAHASCWTLGEFHVLPWELRTHTKPCGCGSPVEQCSFWGPIVADLSGVLLDGSIDRFRDSYVGSRPVRFGELLFLASSAPRHRARKRDDLDRYGKDNLQILQRALEGARAVKGNQVSWLVDASKSVYRLLWLKESGLFDVRVVHLVKDPRAFAYSMCKSNRGMLRPWRLGKAAIRWNIENRLFDRLFRAHFPPEHVLRLRYDELATDPHTVLRQMTRWLDLSLDEELSDKFRRENHGIAGNPARFESAGIRLDEKWRAVLGRATQLLVWGATSRLAWRYGFSW